MIPLVIAILVAGFGYVAFKQKSAASATPAQPQAGTQALGTGMVASRPDLYPDSNSVRMASEPITGGPLIFNPNGPQIFGGAPSTPASVPPGAPGGGSIGGTGGGNTGRLGGSGARLAQL